jgi:short-subunit dehydrogenase
MPPSPPAPSPEAIDTACLRILITGASTGLGLALSQQLLATRHRLILTAREGSLARFAEAGVAASERVWLRALDVTSTQQRRAIVHEVNDAWGGVDVLINNAGIAFRSVVEHVSESDHLAQMEVNYNAPMELTRLVLPRMRAQRWGRILNVSSVGGMMAMPTMSVYSASKFALEGASEALWYEVRPWNIHVSLIEPGFIHSDAFEKVRWTGMSGASKDALFEPYHNHYFYMEGFLARMMRLSRATPHSVAKTVMSTIAAKRPRLRVSATLDAHVFAWLRRLLPRPLYHWVLYRSLPNVKQWGHLPPSGS